MFVYRRYTLREQKRKVKKKAGEGGRKEEVWESILMETSWSEKFHGRSCVRMKSPRSGQKFVTLTDHSTFTRDKKNVRKRNEAVTSGTKSLWKLWMSNSFVLQNLCTNFSPLCVRRTRYFEKSCSWRTFVKSFERGKEGEWYPLSNLSPEKSEPNTQPTRRNSSTLYLHRIAAGLVAIFDRFLLRSTTTKASGGSRWHLASGNGMVLSPLPATSDFNGSNTSRKSRGGGRQDLDSRNRRIESKAHGLLLPVN